MKTKQSKTTPKKILQCVNRISCKLQDKKLL